MKRHGPTGIAAAGPAPPATAWAALGLLLLALLWSHLPALREMWAFWRQNEDYSVGMLVPLMAVYFAWSDRARLRATPVRPAFAGLLVLALAEALRQAGIYYGSASGERYAVVVAIAGVVLLSCGWAMLRRSAAVLAFLLLMPPLPARIHEAIALPLQNLATTLSVFALETFGYFVVREGNVLRLGDDALVAVEEACGGLRMLTAFVFVAAVLALLLERPRWQRATMLVASIPIAVASNAIRVVATSIVVAASGNSTVIAVFHEWAGYAMMPLALGFNMALLYGMARLIRPEPAEAGPRKSVVAPSAQPARNAPRMRAARRRPVVASRGRVR